MRNIVSFMLFTLVISISNAINSRAQIELIIPWDSLAIKEKTSTGSLLDLDIKQLPVSITIITDEEIQQSGARHLSELLEIFVPGFQYMYNKWNGIIWGMRGVAADRNTKFIFLVNGRKMNQESRDGAYSELDVGFLSDLRRVEVLRGPAGLLYGSGSIAGVINLITKIYVQDKIVSESTLQTWGLKSIANAQSLLFSQHIGSSSSLQVYGSFRWSQGTGPQTSRLLGRPSWPYDQFNIHFPKEGAPAEGSGWSTPGNALLSADYQLMDWRIYARYTHQVTDASAFFVKDPWPEYTGLLDSASTLPSKWVDGKLEHPGGFYGRTESWGDNRRQYRVDNLMLQVNKEFMIHKNTLKLNGGFDVVSNKTTLKFDNYYNHVAKQGKNYNTIEQFGEKRFNVTGTYLINKKTKDNTALKYQTALGLDTRIFAFGKDLLGKNEQYEYPKSAIIQNVTYINQAAFAEGVFYLSKSSMLDIGFRYDIHSKTLRHGGLLSSRIGMIYVPRNTGLNFRLVYQSSGNNGSADSYEFNKYNFDANGKIKEMYTFTNFTRIPDENTPVIRQVTKEELEKLKPEKVYSIELSASYQIQQFMFTSSSSYNTIKDLFAWNQTTFRDFNAGKYHFFNQELVMQLSSNNGNWKLGANHVFTRLLNTDVMSGYQLYDKKGISQKDTTYASGFVPIEGPNTDTIRPIRNAITVDGKNFLNLASQITKIYFNYKIKNKFIFHTDARVFWGLTGRRDLQQNQNTIENNPYLYDYKDNFSNNDYPYLEIEKKRMIKWNAGAGFIWKNTTFQFLVYDLLATPNKKNLHSIRWQQMADSRLQTDLYSVDFRSYSLKVIIDI